MLRAVTEATVLKIAERFGKVLKSSVVNKDILYAPDELAFRMRAEKDGRKITTDSEGLIQPTDKYTADFMNVWCTSIDFSWERQRTSVARSGIGSNYSDVTPGGKEKAVIQRAVPVDMTFSVSLWTKYRENVEHFIQEFMFWQQDNPNIELFYDEDKKMEFDVKIGPRVEYDDLSVKQQFLEGKYWKYTFSFVVEVWVVKGQAVRTALHIILDMYAVTIFPEPPVQIPEALAVHQQLDVSIINVAVMVGTLASFTQDEAELRDFLITKGHNVVCLDSLSLAVANRKSVV